MGVKAVKLDKGQRNFATTLRSHSDKMAAHAVVKNNAHAQESMHENVYELIREATENCRSFIVRLSDVELKMAGPLFLGFDLSTQQLKALAIDSDLNVATEASVQFDNDLPEFKTQGGVHKQEDSLTVTAPTLLWVKAFDLVLQRLKEKGLEFRSVACVSGTGQQHGSVYWKKGAKEILRTLKSGKSLYEQLKVGHFSPSWGSCIKICVIPPCGVGYALV